MLLRKIHPNFVPALFRFQQLIRPSESPRMEDLSLVFETMSESDQSWLDYFEKKQCLIDINSTHHLFRDLESQQEMRFVCSFQLTSPIPFSEMLTVNL